MAMKEEKHDQSETPQLCKKMAMKEDEHDQSEKPQHCKNMAMKEDEHDQSETPQLCKKMAMKEDEHDQSETPQLCKKMAMEEDEYDQSEKPQLCKTEGCMYYGYPKSRNLCSVCFKTAVEKGVSKEPTIPVVKVPDQKNYTTLQDNNNVEVKKKKRCQMCKKRVGLINFGCRCGLTFCGLHRMPEEHACQFDFKAAGRAILLKENPLCRADKLETRI